MEKVTLQTLNRGAVVDLFNAELEKVLSNIADENTNPTTVRSITIKLDIKPGKSRREADTKLSVTSKLASLKPAESIMFFDVENGKIDAYEDNPKQEALDFQTGEVKAIGG